MSKRRFRRFLYSSELVMGLQFLTDQDRDKVHDWEVDEFHLDQRASKLNKRRRTRVGTVVSVRNKR